MAITEGTGGTHTPSGTSAETLVTITDAGVYQMVVDVDNLVAGDELELRAQLEVRAGGSAKTLFYAAYAHDQGDDATVVLSPPIPKVASTDLILTLAQPVGTARAFIWSVYDYGNA